MYSELQKRKEFMCILGEFGFMMNTVNSLFAHTFIVPFEILHKPTTAIRVSNLHDLGRFYPILAISLLPWIVIASIGTSNHQAPSALRMG